MLMSTLKPLGELENPSEFIARHIGISAADEQHMLGVIGEASRRSLIESIVPRSLSAASHSFDSNPSFALVDFSWVTFDTFFFLAVAIYAP